MVLYPRTYLVLSLLIPICVKGVLPFMVRESGVRAMSVDEGILMVLGGVSCKYGKRYCYPSQAHILRLLERFYLIKISRRTLNRHLKKLEQCHFFSRQRRHISGPGEKMICRTTLYRLGQRLFKLVKTFGRFAGGFARLLGVPLVSQYSLSKRERDLKVACGGVEILLKSPIEGKPSPVSLDG